MIQRSPYAWKTTEQSRPCPIGCSPVRLCFEEMAGHVLLQHPEPPIPAEIIVLTEHTRR